MKLCAYTICKNESKHVDTWVNGLKDEVDYICVLDTGSTDDTLEQFKKYPFVIVEQKEIKPWRFDNARNESIKLIPEDADVAMVVDLDEVYRPGFREKIEKAFNDGYNLISGYKIVFDESGNQTSNIGEELSLPIIADIRNWHWEYPVHEYPVYYDESKIKEIVVDDVVCEHRPEPESVKSRKQYIDILKNWYESSDPPDAICLEKYSVELWSRGYKDEAYKITMESIDKVVNHSDYTGKITLYRNAMNAAILARLYGDDDKVLHYVEMAKSSGVLTRSLYVTESEAYANVFNDYEKAIESSLKALEITEINSKPYIEDKNLFNHGNIEHDLAFYYYKLGKYSEAAKYEELALDAEYTSERADNLHYYKRYAENKICVYTTCYNESKFIDKWLENNKDADHIVVLVHDCKDDSEEKFKNADIGIPVSIGHGFYKEWRFDKGKNDAMHLAYALAPECNIFVFTSLDEYWDPGWAREVKENWIPGKTQQCWYNFVQSHDEFGHDTGASYFNWMISKDPKWHWEYPIHEAIIYGDNEPINYINLFDKVKLQHWPDKKKPRSYMDLHKLRWEEYKDDISLLYLIREHILWGKIKEAYEISEQFDDDKTDLGPDEHAYIHTMRGICCEYLDDYDGSIEEYKKAWNLNNNLRTPLIRAAVVYARCGAYHKAEELIEKALNETTRTYSWLEDPWDWRSKPFHWLSFIKLKLNKEEEALGYTLFASQIDPDEETVGEYQKLLKEYGK